MSNPKRILIIRLSAIGDVVFASPLIGALKRTYPQASLAWLVEPMAAPLLQSHPQLDEVIVWPKGEWKKLWRERRWGQLLREIKAFVRTLKAREFDLVLDTQGLLKSGVFAYLTGASRRIGLGSKEGSQRLMTEVISRAGNDERISSEYWNLAHHLGLDCGDFNMDIVLNKTDDNYAQTLKQAYGDYIIICPFTTRPQKHWFAQRWGQLVEQLNQRYPDQRVVMLGGPGDVYAANEILAKAPGLVSMVGRSSITQAASLIKHANLLIGVDTGLTHMGIAFARPTITLFGSTCPYTDTTRDNTRVLYHKLACSPCRRNPTCNERFDCMAAIEIEEVMQAAHDLVKSDSL